MSLSAGWLEEVKSVYLQGNNPGEDLRYDETFIQLKAQNAAVSPNAAWMIEKSADLLKKSADLRVCLYAMHGTAIAGEVESFCTILDLYAWLIAEKFESCYPEGNRQKISTFEWCLKSHLVTLLKKHPLNDRQRERLKNALSLIHNKFEVNTGEVLKWRALVDWAEEQTPQERKPAQAPVNTDIEIIEKTAESKPLLEKYILCLLKEGKYEQAIGISRSYRWADLQVPENNDLKTNLMIRQEAIDSIKKNILLNEWKEVLHQSEKLFMEPQAQFFITLSHWSYQALIKLDQHKAADLVLLFIKKLYKNDGQLFSLMYNGGQLFCERETLVWIELLTQDKPTAEFASQNNAMQLIKDQDVEKMKNWLQDTPIKTKIERYVHDLIHLTLSKNDRKDISLAYAAEALFERSIEEDLHAWDPELARSIWLFYAGLLKEEKQKNNNNNAKPNWQAQCDRFSNLVARAHLPAALEIMKYI